MSRSLGLDVGTRTIGIAVSDPLGVIAQPVETYARVGSRKDVQYVAAMVAERQVGRVVVGLPLRTDGSEGPEAESVRRMVESLSGVLDESVDVVFVDERFTTAQAERALLSGNVRRSKRKQVIDQVAAVLILQAHLDSSPQGESF
ncbi:MAG: Holliday junction resolvase RuvX [Proteobacteria bacterium]|nr:Holliday junction resolvase RuvX [Pseudomonadota bacterium]